MQNIKAIKIDVVKKEVYEVELPESIDSLKPIYDLLECSMVEVVHVDGFPDGNIIYIDEEGLLRDEPLGAFKIPGFNQVLSGHGLIVGTRYTEDGNVDASVDPRITVANVLANITFVDVDKLPEPGFIFTSLD